MLRAEIMVYSLSFKESRRRPIRIDGNYPGRLLFFSDYGALLAQLPPKPDGEVQTCELAQGVAAGNAKVPATYVPVTPQPHPPA